MIYSTDSILYKGAVWPPASERSRLTLYSQNQDLFEGNHTKVYTGLLRLFHNSAAEHQKIILILNWHRRLSCLWPDLLIGETPDVKVDDANSDAVKELRRDSSLWPEAYKGLLDMSRFGVGPVKIYKDEDDRVHIQAIAPSKWFPIQAPGGQIIEHVLAWTSENFIDHVLQSYLHVEIHRRGEVETRKYDIVQGKIASDAHDIEIDPSGIDDFLVVPLLNLTTTTNQWGCDDYTPLDPIIRRLETRLTRLGRILDAHSEPVMGVPEEAIGKDPNTGEPTYDSSLRIFPLVDGQAPPQYITWDGQLDASFKEIEFLMSQLYAISETCPQAFGQSMTGGAESGTSLRLRMMAPLKRVERLRLNIDPAIKKIIWLAAQLDGIQLEEQEIGIDWHDGLPNDEYQQMQIEQMAVMNKITSTKAAAKRIYRFSDEQSEEDQKQIAKEVTTQGGGLF